MTQNPVFIALTTAGCRQACTLRNKLGRGQVHGRRGRVDEQGVDLFFDDTAPHLRDCFKRGETLVGFCAAGVLIRALAPVLTHKRQDPPVLVAAEDGSAIVPLLGGHHGANALARELAEITNSTAVMTTASDLRYGIALDDPPTGWTLANPHHYTAFMAQLLAGASLRLEGDCAEQGDWIRQSALPLSPDGALRLTLNEKIQTGSEQNLVFHPHTLTLGVGCARHTPPETLEQLVQETLTAHNLSPHALCGVFSHRLKSDEDAVHRLAEALNRPARFYSTEELNAQNARLKNPSERVRTEVGCPSVAEAAALAAGGPEARLIVDKQKNTLATCAIARAPTPQASASCGRARGRLVVVGLGPGGATWRTAEVDQVMEQVTDLVGYHLYLDLLGAAGAGKTRHGYALGEEEKRVRAALDLAGGGRAVALVCSGDPGIYAMASLVFELLDREDHPDWRAIDLQVVPGISALQAASARMGAVLGHDFCAISLSDLLTPWAVIEKRLTAAAAGDFVIAFYNPVSNRRRNQLAHAVKILSQHRPADTPVIIGRNLGRAGEQVQSLRLDELTVEQVDMLSIVLVGSSATRRLAKSDGGSWIYTPRGYAQKTPLDETS